MAGPGLGAGSALASGLMATDGNSKLIADAFAAWEHGDYGPFLETVADDVTWTVIGSTPISGTFESKQAFLDGAVLPLHERLAGSIRGTLVDVLEDGDHVILRWKGESASKSGRPYHQVYCWVLRLEGGMVVEVTAYLDTELVTRMFED
jgi:ketosteroid isomerase-like protein